MPSRGVQVCVLGGGSWGSTVASIAAGNASTLLWARDPVTVQHINADHRNPAYLGDLPLHHELRATADLKEAVWDADVIVVGIPSHGFRSILEQAAPFVRPWVPIISLTKGLERGTRLRMTQVIDEVIPGHPTGILAGPNLAREVLEGHAAAAAIAMPDQHLAESLQVIFTTKVFRVYTNTDVTGSELGGAFKNVIAIAAGMAEGLGVGDNTRALVITRGLAEIARLGVALGGHPQTFAGLTGLGDLMATCMSPLSRNRSVGVELAKGRTIAEIVDSMQQVAEGVKTAHTVVELAEEVGVEAPIAREVDGVVNHGHSAIEAYRGLRRIQPTSERDGLA